MLKPLAPRFFCPKISKETKNGALCDFTQKCKCGWIFRKQLFLESGSFHSETLGATSSGLVPDNCAVDAIIFMKLNGVAPFIPDPSTMKLH